MKPNRFLMKILERFIVQNVKQKLARLRGPAKDALAERSSVHPFNCKRESSTYFFSRSDRDEAFKMVQGRLVEIVLLTIR
mgnify:CR=1 FL=1